jgi:hypothetical protein
VRNDWAGSMFLISITGAPSLGLADWRGKAVPGRGAARDRG